MEDLFSYNSLAEFKFMIVKTQSLVEWLIVIQRKQKNDKFLITGKKFKTQNF